MRHILSLFLICSISKLTTAYILQNGLRHLTQTPHGTSPHHQLEGNFKLPSIIPVPPTHTNLQFPSFHSSPSVHTSPSVYTPSVHTPPSVHTVTSVYTPPSVHIPSYSSYLEDNQLKSLLTIANTASTASLATANTASAAGLTTANTASAASLATANTASTSSVATANTASAASLATAKASNVASAKTINLANGFHLNSGTFAEKDTGLAALIFGDLPCGIQIESDGLEIAGTVDVSGKMPFVTTVEIMGELPTEGYGVVSCGCGETKE